MTLRMGNGRVKVHPLLPLILAVGALSGMGKRLLVSLAALALHEAGHLLTARGLRLRVEELEITPLGGLMTIPDLKAAPPLHRFLLAAAGPLANLCGLALSPLLYRQGVIPFELTGAFIHANLTLLLVNLLPAQPLDGGQMLGSVMSRFFPERETARWTSLTSSVIGLILCGLTLFFAIQGKIVFAPAFGGLYLLYAAAVEGRQDTAKYITSLIARRQKLERQMVLPVEMVAAGAEMPVHSLLGRLTPGKYHMIHVLSPDGMTRLGVIEEKAFCEAVLSRHDESLGSILTYDNPTSREMSLTR